MKDALKKVNKNIFIIISIFLVIEISAFAINYTQNVSYKGKIKYSNNTQSFNSIVRNFNNISSELESIKSEHDNIVNINQKVLNLFQNNNMDSIKDEITINDIADAQDTINSLYNESVKRELLSKTNKANELLYKKNTFELDINYISQNKNEIYNGCEASCMLMALNYKGYLKGTSFYDFSVAMPKSDDPYTGFYLDIFSREPLDIAHWIAPKPLVEYAKNVSGNANIIDSTGYELEMLKNNVLDGNPVII